MSWADVWRHPGEAVGAPHSMKRSVFCYSRASYLSMGKNMQLYSGPPNTNTRVFPFTLFSLQDTLNFA